MDLSRTWPGVRLAAVLVGSGNRLPHRPAKRLLHQHPLPAHPPRSRLPLAANRLPRAAQDSPCRDRCRGRRLRADERRQLGLQSGPRAQLRRPRPRIQVAGNLRTQARRSRRAAGHPPSPALRRLCPVSPRGRPAPGRRLLPRPDRSGRPRSARRLRHRGRRWETGQLDPYGSVAGALDRALFLNRRVQRNRRRRRLHPLPHRLPLQHRHLGDRASLCRPAAHRPAQGGCLSHRSRNTPDWHADRGDRGQPRHPLGPSAAGSQARADGHHRPTSRGRSRIRGENGGCPACGRDGVSAADHGIPRVSGPGRAPLRPLPPLSL